LRPTFSLTPGYERYRSSANIPPLLPEKYSLFSFPLQANYELDLFGKNHLKVASAKKMEQEVEQDRRVVELAITSAVAGAYVNLIQTDALIQTTQALVDNLSEIIQLDQQLFQVGVIPYDNVYLAQEDYALYHQNLSLYKGQQAVFAHQLSVLTGITPQTEQTMKRVTLDKLDFPQVLPIGVPSELLTRRPDIIEAELALEKAHIDVKEARREFFPTIDLTGQFGFQTTSLASIFAWGSKFLEAAGTLTQPLYTGGFNTANLHYQKAVALEQLNNYHNVLLSAFQDVEDSLALLKANYGEYQANLSQIKSSQGFINIADTRYTIGVGTKLDLLNTQRQLLTYQIVAEQNKGQSVIDLVSLYKALGGGYSP
jgi:multidrug efflux system outer membrane protein